MSTNLWWYPTSYAIFLLLYPFYQRLLSALSEVELIRLIKLELILWSIPSIIPIEWSLGANETTTFFMIYAIIYYIRHFNPKWCNNSKRIVYVIIAAYMIAFSSIIALDLLGSKVPMAAKYSCYYIRGNWRILPMIISIGIFLWCTKINVRHNVYINSLGASTFAVYLIHMHPMMMNWLFKNVFSLESVINMNVGYVMLYALFVTIIIFFVCVAIDKLRILITDYIFSKTYSIVKNKVASI